MSLLARRIRPVAVAAALLSLAAGMVLAGCGGAASSGPTTPLPDAAALPGSAASHIVVIAMENKEASDIIGNGDAPYINGLAQRYGLATASYAITHPSLPNYLALTSGSTDGITSDCTSCHVAAPNLTDQLAAARIEWRAYLEDLPHACYLGAGSGGYAKKHNPFAYYDDVAQDPARCDNLVPLSQLSADLRADRLPTFAWISPNLCDDMHDCDVATGDRFLARLVPPLLHELGPHGFLVLTWDEGSTNAGCCGVAAGGRIATVVAGPDVRPGARSAAPVDHYGVLATVQEALGLPRLAGSADPRNGTLAPLFDRTPRVPSQRTG